MIDYNFRCLSDVEFESLSIDLLSKSLNKDFRRFKPGRDGGIDGRFYADNLNQEIIQCKHYVSTGFIGLKSSLKKELAKVNKIKPTRYFVVTSVPLSANNKIEIKGVFGDYIISDDDIYGQEDLNQLIKDFPEVEIRYYKLWISSTNVLANFLNKAIIGRSKYTLEEIQSKSKYHVQIEAFHTATEYLDKNNVVIITGEPGVGKTTLANQLIIFGLSKGFNFYEISDSISEVENIFSDDEKQLFYFDDFLGSNYLNAIENKQDTSIVRFIKRVKNTKNKKFILTSRTNILNQSYQRSDIFRNDLARKNDEILVKVGNFTSEEKAMILYNHYYFNLDSDYKNKILENKNYNKIINHENFNPRIIEFITKLDNLPENSDDYVSFIASKLKNSKEIWSHTYKEQTDLFGRILVVMTVLNGNLISENNLKLAYNKYIELNNLNCFGNARDFNDVIPEVVKYFLNKNIDSKHSDKISFRLFNPSISDYISNEYKDDYDYLYKHLICLENTEALKNLYSYLYLDFKDIFIKIILNLYGTKNLNSILDKEYVAKLFYFLVIHCKDLNYYKMVEYIEENITDNNFINNDLTTVLFYLLDRNILCNNIITKNILTNIISNIDTEFNININIINDLVEIINNNDFKIDEFEIEIFDYLIQPYVESEITYIYDSISISDYILDENTSCEIYSYLEEELSIIKNNFEDTDLIDIASSIDLEDYYSFNDIETLVQSFMENYDDDSWKDDWKENRSYVDKIDDIFN